MNTRSTLPCSFGQIDDFLAQPTDGVRETLDQVEGDILVLGAGGKMGATLSLMLRKAAPSRRIAAVSRFSDAASRAKFSDIETIPCDLLDREAVAQLPDCPNIFFLAGQKFGTSSAPETTWAMNTVVPAHVAERFKKSRIVVFSTGCVYPFVPVTSGGSSEEDPLMPSGDYAASCVGRERVFTWFSKRFDIPMIIYRLNYSVEPRYGVLVDLAEKIVAGETIDLSTGYLNLIWQRDAVARAIQCLAHAASPPAIMNVTGSETYAVRDLAQKLGAALGREPQFAGTEQETAWLANVEKSVRLWGEPETPVDQMIGWVAAWIREEGPRLNKPTHFEVRTGTF